MLKRVLLGTLIICWCVPVVGNTDPLKLKLTASVEERYSDNVFFDPDDTEDDFITRITPVIQGGWKTEATDLHLKGRADIYKYQEYDDLDAVDMAFNGRYAQKWTPRFSTTLTAGYLNDERRDRELAETGLLFNDDNRTRQTYDLGGQYLLSELSAVSLSYSFQREEFDDPLTYDVDVHTVQFLYTRVISTEAARTTGRLGLTASHYDYGRNYHTVDPVMGAFAVTVDDEQTIDYYAMRVGVAHNWTERFNVTVDLGARFTRKETTVTSIVEPNPFSLSIAPTYEEDESWGYVASLEGVYKYEKGQLRMSVSHDLVPASGRQGTVERSTVKLDGGYYLTHEWRTYWSAKGFLNRSEEGETADEEDELTFQLQAGLSYLIDHQWNIGIYWSSFWIDDRINDVDRTQNNLMLRLQWNWQVLE